MLLGPYLTSFAAVERHVEGLGRSPDSWLIASRAFPTPGLVALRAGCSPLTVVGPCWNLTSFPILPVGHLELFLFPGGRIA